MSKNVIRKKNIEDLWYIVIGLVVIPNLYGDISQIFFQDFNKIFLIFTYPDTGKSPLIQSTKYLVKLW